MAHEEWLLYVINICAQTPPMLTAFFQPSEKMEHVSKIEKIGVY